MEDDIVNVTIRSLGKYLLREDGVFSKSGKTESKL